MSGMGTKPTPTNPKPQGGPRGGGHGGTWSPPKTPGGRRPRRSGPSFYDIPWKAIICLALIALVVAAVYYYRNEISMFISELFAWVIVLLLIVLVFRFLIFPPRRR